MAIEHLFVTDIKGIKSPALNEFRPAAIQQSDIQQLKSKATISAYICATNLLYINILVPALRPFALKVLCFPVSNLI